MSEKQGSSAELYNCPAAIPPSLSRLRSIAEQLGLDIEEKDLKEHYGFVKQWLESCDIVDRYPQPTLPVNYPRTPGYKPGPEENKYNAWAWKTEIRGASSGKLFGKKIAIKDTIAVAGVPLMNGSPLMEGYIPEFEATVVTRILDAGGVIMGKAMCENLSYCTDSFTSVKGPTINPHKPGFSSGGSSSGSAVLVSIGEVDMALGGDQGGSIRIPSSMCGIVGIKPTWGLVPYTGIQGVTAQVDYVGPMASTVKDCALLLEVIAGYDNGFDSRQRPDIEVKEYAKACSGVLEGMKVGILKEAFGQPDSEPEVDKMVRDAALSLSKSGATLEDVSVPMFLEAMHIFIPLVLQGTYEGMIQAAGFPIGYQGYYPISMIEHGFRATKVHLNNLPPLLKPLSLAGEFLRQQYGNKFYNKSANLIPFIKSKFDEVLNEFDVLVFPTVRYKPKKLPSKDIGNAEIIANTLANSSNTACFNLSGHPVLSINTGFTDGLPVGMSFAGKHFDECTVFKVAHAYETIRDAK